MPTQKNKHAMHQPAHFSNSHRYNEDYWTSPTFDDGDVEMHSSSTSFTTKNSTHTAPRLDEPFIIDNCDDPASDAETQTAKQPHHRKKALPVRHKQKPASVKNCPLPPTAEPIASVPSSGSAEDPATWNKNPTARAEPRRRRNSVMSHPGGDSMINGVSVYQPFGLHEAAEDQETPRVQVGDGGRAMLPLRPSAGTNDGRAPNPRAPTPKDADDIAMHDGGQDTVATGS